MSSESANPATLVKADVAPSVIFGVLGLVISWALFGRFLMDFGPDAVLFWSQALWLSDVAGLTWDLAASGAILTVLAVRRARSIGWGAVAAVLATTWILGVCGGLAVYVYVCRDK